jgi:hypothetical protein
MNYVSRRRSSSIFVLPTLTIDDGKPFLVDVEAANLVDFVDIGVFRQRIVLASRIAFPTHFRCILQVDQ